MRLAGSRRTFVGSGKAPRRRPPCPAGTTGTFGVDLLFATLGIGLTVDGAKRTGVCRAHRRQTPPALSPAPGPDPVV